MLDDECLLLGSSLVQYVLEVTCGREGVKILFFKFSTFSLIFAMNFCFGFFIADEFVGGVVMIGIIAWYYIRYFLLQFCFWKRF